MVNYYINNGKIFWVKEDIELDITNKVAQYYRELEACGLPNERQTLEEIIKIVGNNLNERR